MIRRFIEWYFSPSQKPIVETMNVYDKLVELEEKYDALLKDVVRLEEENIETTNVLYELMENIRAVDARIDIFAEHCGIKENV